MTARNIAIIFSLVRFLFPYVFVCLSVCMNVCVLFFRKVFYRKKNIMSLLHIWWLMGVHSPIPCIMQLANTHCVLTVVILNSLNCTQQKEKKVGRMTVSPHQKKNPQKYTSWDDYKQTKWLPFVFHQAFSPLVEMADSESKLAFYWL